MTLNPLVITTDQWGIFSLYPSLIADEEDYDKEVEVTNPIHQWPILQKAKS